MVAFSKLTVAAFSAFADYTLAHTGEPHDAAHMKREIAARDFAAQVGARSLSACSSKIHARSLNQRSVVRRAQKANNLRKKRGITAREKNKRDLEDMQKWEAIKHNMSSTLEHDMFTPLEDVFGANTSCIVAPEVTDGPYYVVGEFMRSNVKESRWSDGVDLFLEVHGISTSGNYAEGGLNSTYLGGIQLTDHDGVASFETIFPGHYSGRAVHTHILAHTNARVQSNGTISVWDAPVAHIGQLSWPDDLREEVEATYPYTLNTQTLTTNDEGMWSIVAADESFDPIPQFVYLGDFIQDGLFAWIQIGINGSADYTDDDYYSITGYIDAEGGHSTGSQVGGGGEGGPGGNGTMPSGSPSGSGVPSGALLALTSA
ncbi:hypothetical protein DL765_000880 [Monosporascus sp. GIB2]|nr:hypothetical protein DL765_000880 [Monosporascus sp. GIB2]